MGCSHRFPGPFFSKRRTASGVSDPIWHPAILGRTNNSEFHFPIHLGKGPSLGAMRNRIARVSAKYPVTHL